MLLWWAALRYEKEAYKEKKSRFEELVRNVKRKKTVFFSKSPEDSLNSRRKKTKKTNRKRHRIFLRHLSSCLQKRCKKARNERRKERRKEIFLRHLSSCLQKRCKNERRQKELFLHLSSCLQKQKLIHDKKEEEVNTTTRQVRIFWSMWTF